MEAAAGQGRRFRLRVISPDREILNQEVSAVKLPAHDGYLGILYNHAPMIALLGTGVLAAEGELPQTLPYRLGPIEIFVSNGFVQVDHNEVRVVCDAGENVDDIDLERAREAEKRARERLNQQMKADLDRPRASAALQRSMIRTMLAEKHHRRRSQPPVR